MAVLIGSAVGGKWHAFLLVRWEMWKSSFRMLKHLIGVCTKFHSIKLFSKLEYDYFYQSLIRQCHFSENILIMKSRINILIIPNSYIEHISKLSNYSYIFSYFIILELNAAKYIRP